MFLRDSQSLFAEWEKNSQTVMTCLQGVGKTEDDLYKGMYPLFFVSGLLMMIHGGNTAVMMEYTLLVLCEHIMKSDNKVDHQIKEQLLLTGVAAGRAEEVKFLDYAKLFWEHQFQTCMGCWLQPKQLSIVLTSFGIDIRHFELCPLTNWSIMWTMDEGIHRQTTNRYDTETFCTPAAITFVFTGLHNKSDGCTSSGHETVRDAPLF